MKGILLRHVAALAFFVTGAAGQATLESPPAGVPADRFRALPIEAEKQAALQSAVQSHNYTAAENLVAEEATRNPKSQALLLLLADLLFLDGRQLNTVVVLKKAELLGDLDERSRFLLALSYIALGRKNLAIPELEKLEKSKPSSAVYPYWLSRLAYRKMDLEAALSHARQAVRLDPEFAKAYDQLGLCYAGLARNDEAIQAFEQAMQLNRRQSLRWPWPAMNLGTLYLRLERLDEAEVALHESIAQEPAFPVAHFRLGQVLQKKEKWDDAVRELKEAVRLDPTYPEPHYVLARIYKKQKDEASAREELRAFQQLRSIDKQKGITRPD